MPISWPDMFAMSQTQHVYDALIAAKNEWNARAERGETYTIPKTDIKTVVPLKRAYLHFENLGDSCACGDSKKPGTHAKFACTITKYNVP